MRYLGLSLVLLLPGRTIGADETPLRGQAQQGLRKATEFFRTRVAVEGGYLWRYSADLQFREGEGKASETQAWVQPPGTPSIGMAFMAAYDATGQPYYLEAARETAIALMRGQLRSGGWTYSIEFDPGLRDKVAAYRLGNPGPRARNVTSLDDNTTQAALRLLMRVDKALDFKDARIHEATQYALASLLRAQYPNGAWPQGYIDPPNPDNFPVKRASYPETWSRTAIKQDYWFFYTLNDNVLADVVDVLLEAERTYKEPRFREAMKQAGAFLLAAQMPEPQPGWAQQYNFDMQPTWARRFEPPSITGGEAQGAMQTLLRLYRETGDARYLEPLPRALAYYRRSLLPDGRLARFYELKTNKPLYFTKDYQLTYSDEDVPTHYGFKVGSKLDAIEKELNRLKALDPQALKQPEKPGKRAVSDTLTAQVKEVLAALDDQGRWVEDGMLKYHGPNHPTKRIIDCATFIRNANILSNYLAATAP